MTFYFQHEITLDMRNAKEVVMDIYSSVKKVERIVLNSANRECVTRSDIDSLKQENLRMQGNILALERAYNKTPEPEVGG